MKRISLFLTAAVLVAACAKPQPQAFHVIPMPADVTVSEGSYAIAGKSFFLDPRMDDASSAAVWRFKTALEKASGKVSPLGKDEIQFLVNPNLAAEQYAINVTEKGATVEASALNGFVYACETLKQMLPAAIYGDKPVKAHWVLPCVEILDQPRFDYRGMHLDVSRHFWTVDEVKRYLDVMSVYKLNRLHWHLTDDQGWRVEIKAYPKLTEISAWRNGTVIKKDWGSNDGIRYGGFYTQEEMKEVVAYAAARGITVIPEVDLPGHMVAALSVYPDLGCTGGPYFVRPYWGVDPDVLCAGNPETLKFIHTVLGELCEVFPSKYIHVGGDESPRDRWKKCEKCQNKKKELQLDNEAQLQTYILKDVEKFLSQHGRELIGWDEILEGGLSEGATVMSWRGYKGGITAARLHHRVIMTPTDNCYIDYYQLKNQRAQPHAIGGYLPLSKVYAMEPIPNDLTEEEGKFILGAQCNLWTEYVLSPKHAEYMLLPRLDAMCEVQWLQPDQKNFEAFTTRLADMEKLYRKLGYSYCTAYE